MNKEESPFIIPIEHGLIYKIEHYDEYYIIEKGSNFNEAVLAILRPTGYIDPFMRKYIRDHSIEITDIFT